MVGFPRSKFRKGRFNNNLWHYNNDNWYIQQCINYFLWYRFIYSLAMFLFALSTIRINSSCIIFSTFPQLIMCRVFHVMSGRIPIFPSLLARFAWNRLMKLHPQIPNTIIGILTSHYFVIRYIEKRLFPKPSPRQTNTIFTQTPRINKHNRVISAVCVPVYSVCVSYRVGLEESAYFWIVYSGAVIVKGCFPIPASGGEEVFVFADAFCAGCTVGGVYCEPAERVIAVDFGGIAGRIGKCDYIACGVEVVVICLVAQAAGVVCPHCREDIDISVIDLAVLVKVNIRIEACIKEIIGCKSLEVCYIYESNKNPIKGSSTGQWYPKVITEKGFHLPYDCLKSDINRIIRIHLIEERPEFPDGIFDPDRLPKVEE